MGKARREQQRRQSREQERRRRRQQARQQSSGQARGQEGRPQAQPPVRQPGEGRRVSPDRRQARRREEPGRTGRPPQGRPHAGPPAGKTARAADRPRPQQELKRRRRPKIDAAARRRRRRRVMAVFYFFLFLLVLGTALTLSLTVLFRVETIEVQGESRYTAEQILEASGLETGGNLFLTDIDAASEAIEKKLPYIGEADVKRVLPSEIEIAVSEEQVAGAVLDDTQYILVGVSGKVLERVTERPEGYPLVKGMVVQSAVIGTPIVYEDGDSTSVFEKLAQAIDELSLENVTEIDLTDSYSTTVLYDNRILLKLGPPTSFKEKLNTFLTLLEGGNLTDTDRGTLDLSLVVDTDRSYFSEDFSVSSAVSSDPAASSADGVSSAGDGSQAAGTSSAAAQ